MREVTTGLQPQLLGAGGCRKMVCIGAWIIMSTPENGARSSQEVVTEEWSLGRGRVVL